MKKLFKTRLFFQVAIATLAATLATVGIVAATTTIGTSINTGGTLTVTSTTATSTISTGGLTVGTSQFVVQQTSGNVGIGTTTPLSQFDIYSGSSNIVSLLERGGGKFLATFAGLTSSGLIIDNSGSFIINSQSAADRGTTNNITNRFIIDVNGRVGIGVTTPWGQLSASTTSATRPALVIEQNSTGPAATFLGGNVGIGTTTPGALLNIASTLPRFYLSDTDSALNNKHWFMENNAGVLSFGTTTDALAISGTRAISITNTGSIGIGTSSPASLLHVSAGTNATTTVEFGAQDVTSKTCFNVRDALGAATSFYFVGTAMVVEANRCR